MVISKMNVLNGGILVKNEKLEPKAHFVGLFI